MTEEQKKLEAYRNLNEWQHQYYRVEEELKTLQQQNKQLTDVLLKTRNNLADTKYFTFLLTDEWVNDIDTAIQQIQGNIVKNESLEQKYKQLGLNYQALKETDAEIQQSYIKAHNERYALQEQNKLLIETLTSVATMEVGSHNWGIALGIMQTMVQRTIQQIKSEKQAI